MNTNFIIVGFDDERQQATVLAQARPQVAQVVRA